MRKTKKACALSVEDKIKIFSAAGVILMTMFSLYSGGELLGLAAVVLVLALAYKTVRHLFNELSFEKLFFLIAGLYFTLISIFGFVLLFLGFKLSVENFLIITILVLAAVSYITKGRNQCKVTIDNKRLLLIGGSFFIAFFVYMWPSLPSFVSPCTFGFDCTLHMEYAANIYELGLPIPPITDWRYYPNSFHINTALLTHALEPNMPTYTTLIYPLTALIAALIVGMLCGMIYDRVKNKLYVILFLIAILGTVYPASALICFGFWANILGMYYAVLFAWALSEFVGKPKDKKIMVALLLVTAGSLIAYQILTTLILIISFLLASLSLIKIQLSDRIKLAFVFLIAVGVIYSVYTLEGYSKYLAYSYESFSTKEYLTGYTSHDILTNPLNGGLDTKLNGSKFQITSTGLHVEDVYVIPGLKVSRILSDGLSLEKIGDFMEIGRYNIRGPSGNAIYFDLKWFGLLTIFLMVLGLIYSYGKRDYTLVFLEASIIHLFIFSVGMEKGQVNSYYYSKMMYFFIYPVTLYAIVGIEELLSRMDAISKKAMVLMVVIILMMSYGMGLISKDKVGLLIGERKDLYENGAFWPLLEFNRFLRCWDMIWGIKRDTYGVGGWLRMMNMSAPVLTEKKIPQESVTSGVWLAAPDFPQHELGHGGPDGSWVSEPGGFGYMIGRNYMTVPPGSYIVSFKLKINDNSIQDQRKVATIAVSKDYGVNVLVVEDLFIPDFKENDTYQDFILNLDTSEVLENVDFRVHYDKSLATVTVKEVSMTQN